MWDDLWEERLRKENEPEDAFIAEVRRGMKGQNVGIEDGMGRINQYLYGIHRARYYLVGADSGVGKSTRSDFRMINLWETCSKRGIPLDIFYYSFEMSKTSKIANWVASFIYRIYGIEMPADYILGRIDKNVPSNTDLKYIKVAYGMVRKMMENMYFMEGTIHPTGLLSNLIDRYYDTPEIGTILRGPSTEKNKKGPIIGFRARDPQRMTFLMIDHLALGHQEKGLVSIKDVIDKFSLYFVQLRNLMGTTIQAIQQFNAELLASSRLNRKTEEALIPQRLDFGDSKYTYRDADVVEGLLMPAQFGLPTFKGYNLLELETNLVFNFLMKNRYGISGRAFPMLAHPMVGMYKDLPLEPNNMLKMEPYYKEVKRINAICQSFSPQSL
jgi:hypothetical protein